MFDAGVSFGVGWYADVTVSCCGATAFPNAAEVDVGASSHWVAALSDQGLQHYEEQQRQLSIAALKRSTAALGFQLNPTTVPT